MKLLKISSLFLFVLLIASCGSDDDTCTQADWVGVYNGTANCGTSETAVITVTASGTGDIVVKYVSTDASGGTTTQEYSPITLDGTNCSLDETQTDGTNTAVFDGSLSDKTFTLKVVISGALNETCTITGTK